MGKKENHRRSRSRSSSSSSSDEEMNEECLKKMYNELKCKLMKDKSLMPAGSDAYGSFYSLDAQQINPSEPVVFKYAQASRNVDICFDGQIVIPRRDGIYFVTIHLTPDGAGQWTVFVNNKPQYDRIFGTYNSSGQVTITYLIALRANDLVTVRNYESNSSVISIPQIVGGTDAGANAEIVLEKIAPYPEKYNDNKHLQLEKHESESSSEERKEKKLKHKFDMFKKWMKYDPSLMAYGCDCYGSFYSTREQDVAVDANVLFDLNQNVLNMTHTLGSGDVTIQKAGVYMFIFIVQTTQSCQFTIFVNGVPNQTTTAGINKGANVLQLRQEIELNAGDVVSVKNHVSATGSIKISQNSGGTLTGINAEFIVYKVAVPQKLLTCNEQVMSFELEKDCVYRKFKHYLLEDEKIELEGSEGYYFVSSTVLQTLNLEDSVYFGLQGLHKNTLFKTGTDTVTVLKSGVYNLTFDLQARQPSQFTIYVNNVPNNSTIAGTDSGSGQVSVRQLLELNKGDVLSVKNHSSFLNPVITSMNPGGKKPGVNTIFTGFRLGPLPKKPCPPQPPQPPKPQEPSKPNKK